MYDSLVKIAPYLLIGCFVALLYGCVLWLLRDTNNKANGYYYNNNYEYIIITKNTVNFNGEKGTIEYYDGTNFEINIFHEKISGFYGDNQLKILKPGEKLGDTHNFIIYKLGGY